MNQSTEQGLPGDTKSEAIPREIFTDKQACAYLGISPVTLWRERKNRRISFRRVAGSIRYTKADIDAYLDRNLQAAANA